MALSRRALLSTGAASAVILGGAGAWLANGEAQAAREPWRRTTQGFGDHRLDALAYAILAPNPHNMQPWMIRLDGDDRIALYADESRLLPETDPPARQITIGFGAFIELLRQAAAEQSTKIDVAPFPDGEPHPTLDERPIALITFSQDPGTAPDPLFAQTLKRHTQRDPYDTQRPVAQGQIDRILAAATEGVSVAGTAEAEQREGLRNLTQAAWITEWTHGPTRRETIAVTRIGRSEVLDRPWGITLDGPLMNILGTAGLLSREGMDVPGTASHDETLRVYNEACATAMGLYLEQHGNQYTTGSAEGRCDLGAPASGGNPRGPRLPPPSARPCRSSPPWPGTIVTCMNSLPRPGTRYRCSPVSVTPARRGARRARRSSPN